MYVVHVVMRRARNGQLEMSNEEAYAHMQQLIIQSQNAFIPQMVREHISKRTH